MAKGLPKAIAKKYGITKKAWSVYRAGKKGNKKSVPKKKGKKKRSQKSKGNRKMVKNMTIPIAVVAPVVANMISPLKAAAEGNWDGVSRELLLNWVGIGYDGKFQLTHLVEKYTPIVIGGLIHKFVGGKPLNVNATLGRAGVPFIRI